MRRSYFDFEILKRDIQNKIQAGYCAGPILDHLSKYKPYITAKQWLACLFLLRMELLQPEVKPFLMLLQELLDKVSAKEIHEFLLKRNESGDNLLTHCARLQERWTEIAFVKNDLKPLLDKLSKNLAKETKHKELSVLLEAQNERGESIKTLLHESYALAYFEQYSQFLTNSTSSTFLAPPNDPSETQITRMLNTLRR